MASIFTQIIQGKIPCYKIYEDELVFVFLDITPIQEGHMLVVPKDEVDQLQDLPDAIYQHVFQVGKVFTDILKKAMGSQRVWYIVEGFWVPHAHLHLVPINEIWDLDQSKASELPKEKMASIQKNILSQITHHE